jgi:hypothetical protein
LLLFFNKNSSSLIMFLKFSNCSITVLFNFRTTSFLRNLFYSRFCMVSSSSKIVFFWLLVYPFLFSFRSCLELLNWFLRSSRFCVVGCTVEVIIFRLFIYFILFCFSSIFKFSNSSILSFFYFTAIFFLLTTTSDRTTFFIIIKFFIFWTLIF